MNKKKYIWQRQGVLVFAFLLLVLLLPFGLKRFTPIEFNQFLIQRIKITYHTATVKDYVDTLRSSYWQGIVVLKRMTGDEFPKTANYDSPVEFFEYVFSWIPSYAVVYPTEKFYYYSFDIPGFKQVGGNIRLADLYKGEFNIAYFPIDQSETFKSQLFRDGENGVSIKKIDDYNYRVTYKNKTVHFHFPKYAHSEITIPLLDDEKFIGKLFDESGTGLFIIYNKKANSFYEVLDEKEGFNDKFTDLSDGFLLANRTQFIYYSDKETNRKILVSVNSGNSMANNFLDGPGDQVPIDINFKKELVLAYPSLLSGDGTDDFGVWLNKPEWQRFVMAPFGFFVEPADTVKERGGCLSETDKSVLWTCLTKEWWNTPDWREMTIQRIKNEGKLDLLSEYGVVR